MKSPVLPVLRLFHDMPDAIDRLPRDDRGFPIPAFVEYIDGKPDFRVMSRRHLVRCVQQDVCWICGGKLGSYKAFVIGPMCAINRCISEPPSHRACAVFAAKNCPFLSRPMARRRTEGLPENRVAPAGYHLDRNPAATAVYITKSFRVFATTMGVEGELFELGPPIEVLWFADGRMATRAEVEASIAGGMAFLQDVAAKQGPKYVAELERMVRSVQPLLPPG